MVWLDAGWSPVADAAAISIATALAANRFRKLAKLRSTRLHALQQVVRHRWRWTAGYNGDTAPLESGLVQAGQAFEKSAAVRAALSRLQDRNGRGNAGELPAAVRAMYRAVGLP